MLRNILALIGGLVAGSAFNMAVILLSWLLYPLPRDMDFNNPEAMGAYVRGLPTAALLLVLLAHAGGSFVGGVIAGWIGRRARWVLGTMVGLFFLVGGALNVVSLPAPLWFEVVDLISYLPCAVVGAGMFARRTPDTAISGGDDGS